MSQGNQRKSNSRAGSVCVVAQEPDGWSLRLGDHCDVLPESATPEQIGQEVHQSLVAWGQSSATVVLAPASKECFFYTLVDAKNDLDFRDRSALKFELEDHLPVDAEAMVADFVVVSDSEPRSASCIAIKWQRWKSIADEIENAGHIVSAIVPSSVLIARAVQDESGSTNRRLILISEGDQVDQIEMLGNQIVDWKICAATARAIKLQRKIRKLDESTPVFLLDDSDQHQAAVAAAYPNVQSRSQPRQADLIRGANLYQGSEDKRWFDLRRDELAPADSLRGLRSQLRGLAIAATIFLLALVVGGWWRGERIESEIGSLRNQQTDLFRQTFPEARVPAALLRRVRSEHTRMLGSRGAKTLIDVPVSAPMVLQQILAGLPQDVRFQIQRIEVKSGEIDLDVQSLSPVDAGKIAESLSAIGFSMKPPVTIRSEDGSFNSQIRGEWVGKKRAADGQDSASMQQVQRSPLG